MGEVDTEDNNKRIRVVITIILTVIEFVVGYALHKTNVEIDSWWMIFLSYAAPCGFLWCANYYIFSPAITHIIWIIWQFSGHYERTSGMFAEITEKCCSWLVNVDKLWGTLDTSEECQSANTCEGLLALLKSDYKERYITTYMEAREEVLGNLTNKGLPSKSLNRETVVCTSMILYIASLDEELKENHSYSVKFKHISDNLRKSRCRDGWGVYIGETKNKYCCIANSLWALRALNCYDISKTNDFKIMVRRIYEKSSDSLFGYSAKDSPRLITTAASVSLYFALSEDIRNTLMDIYDVKKAIRFVYNKFCITGIEYELEVLHGVDRESIGARKVPWTHVGIAFVAEALVYAHKEDYLSVSKWNLFLLKMKSVCKKSLVYVNGGNSQCYYLPRDMEVNTMGVYTFPTSYMAWALGVLSQGLKDKYK